MPGPLEAFKYEYIVRQTRLRRGLEKLSAETILNNAILKASTAERGDVRYFAAGHDLRERQPCQLTAVARYPVGDTLLCSARIARVAYPRDLNQRLECALARCYRKPPPFGSV